MRIMYPNLTYPILSALYDPSATLSTTQYETGAKRHRTRRLTRRPTTGNTNKHETSTYFQNPLGETYPVVLLAFRSFAWSYK